MKVVCDLDGVVFDFAASLRGWLVDHCGWDPVLLGEARTWDFFANEWGLARHEFERHCHEGVDAGIVFRHGPALPGAIPALADLTAAGHSIHFCTARDFGSRSEANTAEWLAEHGVAYDAITFTSDKTTVAGDLLLDDWIVNYRAVQRAGTAVPVLMHQPWNADERARRVRSWDQFVGLVASLDGGPVTAATVDASLASLPAAAAA